jgi:tyrosyl-tRNA synthetase
MKVITNPDKIKEALEKGVEKVYPSKKALEKILKSGKRIRLYCGYDPTAPSLHIGHAITLRKLAQFQKLGHEVIFLIGDFTGMIGDPTDKTSARKRLTREQVNKNLKNYKKQASKILKFSGENPAKLMFNSKWNDKLEFVDLIELASNFTVQQMVARNMFQERIKKDRPIYLHEFLYPLTQAYDSVAMDIDLEVGGNDQTFNMLRGRDLMKNLKNKEKFVLTTKLLVDPIGQKMGKTERNVISLDETPKEMFGQIMAWPDSLIILGLELCTDISIGRIEEINKQIKIKKANPRDIKAELAKIIVATHYSKSTALQAEREFNKVFKERELPSKIKSYKLQATRVNILDLLIKIKLAPSKSEAKRLIEQGAVKIDKKPIKNWKEKIIIKKKMIIQAGKRRFVKII